MDANCEILGHLATLNCVDASLLERFGEATQVGVVVKLCAVLETC